MHGCCMVEESLWQACIILSKVLEGIGKLHSWAFGQSCERINHNSGHCYASLSTNSKNWYIAIIQGVSHWNSFNLANCIRQCVKNKVKIFIQVIATYIRSYYFTLN